MTNLERNKETVVAFFTQAFNDKQPQDAVAKYAGSQYIQHNPDTPGDHRGSRTEIGQIGGDFLCVDDAPFSF